MSKRIRELIDLSYNAGWISGQIETGLVLPVKLVARQDQQAGIVMARNAARDALEAALAEALAAMRAALDLLEGCGVREGYVEDAKVTVRRALYAALAKLED